MHEASDAETQDAQVEDKNVIASLQAAEHVYLYFCEWRNKLIVRLFLVTATCVAASSYILTDGSTLPTWLAVVPMLAICVFSIACIAMDGRNAELLIRARDAAAQTEEILLRQYSAKGVFTRIALIDVENKRSAPKYGMILRLLFLMVAILALAAAYFLITGT